jgi:hypothetical protein
VRKVAFRLSPLAFRVSLFAALIAPAAWAGDNDPQLFRLGHVDDITVCTKCDGTDRTIEPGDPLAQTRFARYATTLGLMFAPSVLEPAATTGEAGFEIGFTGKVAFPRLAPSEWPTAATEAVTAPPTAVFLPTLSLRKGLGGSFELGMSVSMLGGSQIFGIGLEARWAPLEGIDFAPDLALRIYGTRLVGTQELDLAVGGGDVLLSKSFGIAGMVKLQPFVQYGIAMVNATTGVIDFHPQSEDIRDPTADDGVFRTINFFQNRYARLAFGFRLVAGVAVLGVEGSYLNGTNAVQHDKLSDGTLPPTQTTKLWSVSGRVGLQY